MRMISYAQNREDVLLDRAFPRGVPGTYIDIGAYDPVLNSVTKHFYDLGWSGINVEPAGEAFERLRTDRVRDINLNVGLSSAPGTLTFFESPPESGWSTFDAGQAAWHRKEGLALQERLVSVRTLRDVCEEYVDGPVDFMSVDVEGHEAEVLRGGDWERWRPRVVLVEATKPGTAIPTYDAWEPILLKADYMFAAFDGLNRYYVRAEDAALAQALQVPANVLDDYLPYGHHKQVEDLRNAVASMTRMTVALQAANEAERAANQALQEEANRRRRDVEALRAEYQRLDVVLAQTRARYEAAVATIQDTRLLHDELLEGIASVRAGMDHLVADVGPATLSVAKAIGRLGRRVPGAGVGVRAARLLKRRLRPVGR